jgi:hypothetical protein
MRRYRSMHERGTVEYTIILVRVVPPGRAVREDRLWLQLELPELHRDPICANQRQRYLLLGQHTCTLWPPKSRWAWSTARGSGQFHAA